MPDPKHVTLTQIARAAGLSIGTVSLALRDSPLLLAETKRVVRATAEKLGYHLLHINPERALPELALAEQ